MWCVVVCDLETSRMGAPYIYDISRLRVNLTHHSLWMRGCGLTQTCISGLLLFGA